MTPTKETRPLQPGLGQRIRAKREAAAMTQTALAEAIGVSGPALCYIEGGRNTPTLGTIIALANRLGVTVGELIK